MRSPRSAALVRLATLAVAMLGCGGPSAAPAAPVAPPVRDVLATRWVPAAPTYVFTSRSLEVAQASLRDAIELLGTLTGFDLADAVRAVSELLAVDALHPDPVAAIGVDPHASWAVFSDDLSPTLVVRLAAPELMTAFLDRQRERGMATRSVVVDAGGSKKTEVVSASLSGQLTISWAIEADWMWIHLVPRSAPDDGARWFTASHTPHDAPWVDRWTWAERAAGAAARVVGFLDLHGAIARALARAPDALACTRLIAPARLIAVSVESDGRRVAARIAFDVGATDAIRGALLAPPSGWAQAAAGAPLAVQWNLEVAAVRAWLAPCLSMFDADLATLDATQVRAARGLVLGFDPDSRTGSGALAFDVADPAFFVRQLDRIPLRSTLERSRTFGGHKGASIAIPFAVTIEYVIEPGLVIGALGEGVLGKLFAARPAASEPPPIFAIDLVPPAMSARAWATAIHAALEQELSTSPGPVLQRTAERLQRWHDVHVGLTAELGALVFTLSAHRR